MLQNRYMLLLFGFLLLITAASAQPANALLIGRLEGAEGQILRVEINKKYLDNTVVDEFTEVNADGKFGFVLYVELPQLVTLCYRNKRLELYLEPNDTLHVDLQASHFPEDPHFSGRGAANNAFYRAFRRRFSTPDNVFEYRYYKKNSYTYSLHQQLDSFLQATPPAAFLDWWRREQADRQALLSAEKQLTSDFRQFIQSDIAFRYQYLRLAYGHLYRYRHRLEQADFVWLDSAVVQCDACLGHPQYREWIQAYLNYQQEVWTTATLETPQRIAAQYRLADTLFQGLTRYFAQAYLIEKGLRSEQLEAILPLYEDFVQRNPYRELDRLVVDALQRVRPFAAGTPAPSFLLPDTLGNRWGLRDFQGKQVYLGFWASWCRPCLKKMRELEADYAAETAKGRIFVHISLDRDEAEWRATLAREGFSGIHLRAAFPSSVTDDYRVLSVPRFFWIRADGTFGE